jgi:isopentenyl phosphate kinase
MSVIILKLGGSVLAPKHAKRPFLRRKLLAEIGSELAKTFPNEEDQLIIIHGGGSFCHPLAKRFELSKGTRGDGERERVALEVREICRKLNREIATSLFRYLPVESIDTPSIVRNADGKLGSIDTKPIRDALDQGVIPVLSGHVVADETLGMSVASGDALAAALADAFGSETVFFASDVNGIFSENPHLHRKARQFPKLSFQELEDKITLSGAAHTDATGGMKEKLLTFFKNKDGSAQKIIIFDGRNAEAFSRLTDSSFPFGTTVTR